MKMNIFVSVVSSLLLKLIYHGAGMVVYLLLLKFSMTIVFHQSDQNNYYNYQKGTPVVYLINALESLYGYFQVPKVVIYNRRDFIRLTAAQCMNTSAITRVILLCEPDPATVSASISGIKYLSFDNIVSFN